MEHFQNILGAPTVRVKIVTVVHLILLINAMFSSWAPPAYLFYNTMFMFTLFWTIHAKESVEAALMAALINIISFVFDFAIIIAFYDYYYAWSGVFGILNMIARPISLLLLHREYTDRGGTLMAGTIFPAPSQQRSYEDMDRPNQSVPTNNQQSSHGGGPSVVTF